MSDIETRKNIPIARYWQLRFLGPFTKANGETCDGCLSDVGQLQYGAVVMQSGDTNVRMRKERLPKVRVDSPLAAVRHTGAQLELVDATTTSGDWSYNETVRIGKTAVHGIHYEYNYLSNITTGGVLEYEFEDLTRVNEIILVNTLATGEISHVPDKLVINYSVDGDNWSTEKEYVFGIDWNVRFTVPNPDGIHTSAIVLKRSRLTNMWTDAILLENMRESVGNAGYMSDEYGERAFANAYNKPQFKCADFRSSVHPASINVSDMCESVSQTSDGYPQDSLKATLHASTFLSDNYRTMNHGFSYYAPVWAPVSSPFTHTNINLPFSFIYNSANTACKTQQVLEAGPRYLHAHKFKHGGFPKLMMSMTNDCYQSEVNSLGFRYSGERGTCDNVLFNRLSDNELSIVQFSNKILLPPDGLPFGGAPNGELLGTALMSLPLTGSSADPVNHWTLFINTKNFKGPLAYFMPEKLRSVDSDGNHHGLDRKMMQNGLHFGMQIESLPSTVEGDYAKIPSIKFPLLKGKSITELVKDVFSYSGDGLYKKVELIRDDLKKTGKTNKSKIDPFFMLKNTHGFKTTLYTSPTDFTFGDVRVTGMEPNIAEKVSMNNVGVFYKWNALNQQIGDASESAQQAGLPEYMHRWTHDAWRPIGDFQLQSSSEYDALKAHTFDTDGDEGGIYTVLNDQGRLSGAWANPGPARDVGGKIGPYDVLLADGSTVVYYWYRFVDQPAFKQIRGSKSAEEWNNLQDLVTALHKSWQPNLNYIPNPTSGKLVDMDPGLIVCPPSGLEHGYVPIVVAQYKRAKALRRPAVCTDITHAKSGLGLADSVNGVLRCGSDTYATVPASKECSSVDYSLIELDIADRCISVRNSLPTTATNRLPLMVDDIYPYGCVMWPVDGGGNERLTFNSKPGGRTSTGNRICKYNGITESYRDRLITIRLANADRLNKAIQEQQDTRQKELLIQYNNRLMELNNSIVDIILKLDELDVSILNIQRSITTGADITKLNAEYAQDVVNARNAELQNYVHVSDKITASIQGTSIDEASLEQDFDTIIIIIDRLNSIQTTAESLLTSFNDFSIQSLRNQIDAIIMDSPKLKAVKKRVLDIDTSILIADDIEVAKKKIDDYTETLATTLGLTHNKGYTNHVSNIETKLNEFNATSQRIRNNLENVSNSIHDIDNIKKYIGTYSDADSLNRANSEIQRIIDEDITLAENVTNLDLQTILSIISSISNSERVIMNHIRHMFLINSDDFLASFNTRKLGLQAGLDAVPAQFQDMDDTRKQFEYIVNVLRQVYADLKQIIVNKKPEATSISDDAKAEFATLTNNLKSLSDLRESFTENSMDVFASFIQLIESIQTNISSIEQKLERITVLKDEMRISLLTMSATYYRKMNNDVYGISMFKHNAILSIRKFRDDILNKNDRILVNVGFDARRIDNMHLSYFNGLEKSIDDKRKEYSLLKAQFEANTRSFYDTIDAGVNKSKPTFPVRNVNKDPVRSDFDLFVSVYNDMYVDSNGGKALFDKLMSMGENEFGKGEFGKEVIDDMKNFTTAYHRSTITRRKSTINTTSSHKQIDFFQPPIPSNKMLTSNTIYTNHFVNFHNDYDSLVKIAVDIEIAIPLKQLGIHVTQRPDNPSSTRNAWFVMQLYNGVLNLSFMDYKLGEGDKAIGRFKSEHNGSLVDPSMKIAPNATIGNLTGRVLLEFEYSKKNGLTHKIVSGGRTHRFANMAYKDDGDKIRWTSPDIYSRYIDTQLPKKYTRSRDELLFEQSAYQVKAFQSNVKLHSIDVRQFSFDYYVCPPEPCEGSWSEWSDCTKECEGGQQTRRYTIKRFQRHGGEMCEARHNQTDSKECNTHPCPIDCKGAWGGWSRDCKDGLQRRVYEVRVPAQYQGETCKDKDSEEEREAGEEETRTCPQNCEGEWEGWTECSKECGGGFQSNTYRVKRMGNESGQGCPFDDGKQINRKCNEQLCEPVSCTGGWGAWEECDQVCETRKKVSRTWQMDKPARHGGTCPTTETKNCDIKPCPVHCDGAWSDWSECTALCGGGMQERTYTIKREADHGGFGCLTTHGKKGVRLCNMQPCVPNDCLGTWSDWEQCDQPCGERKTVSRQFTITQDAMFGGRCPPPSETKQCPAKPCPIPCKGAWTEFGECRIDGDAKCGKGVRARDYEIEVYPQHGGAKCPIFPNEMYEQECDRCEFEDPTSNDVDTIKPPLLSDNLLDKSLEHILSLRPTKNQNVRLYLNAEIELPEGVTLGGHGAHIITFTQRMVDGIDPRKGFHFQIYNGGIMFQYYDKDFYENRNGIIELHKIPTGYFSVREVPELNAMSGRIRIQLMLTESHVFMLQFNDYRIDRSNSKTVYQHGPNTIDKYKKKMFSYPECTYPKMKIESQLRGTKLHSIYAEHFRSSDICQGAIKWSPCVNNVKCGNVGARNQYLDASDFQFDDCKPPELIQNEACVAAGFRACGAPAIVNDARFEDDFAPALDTGMIMRRNVQYFSNKIHNTGDPNVILYFECVVELPPNMKFGAGGMSLAIDAREPNTDNVAWWRFQMHAGMHMFIFSDKNNNPMSPDLWFRRPDRRNDDALRELTGDIHVKIMYTSDYGLSFSINDLDMRYDRHFGNHLVYTQRMRRDIAFTNRKVALSSQHNGLKVKSIYLEQNEPISLDSPTHVYRDLYDRYVGRMNTGIGGGTARKDTTNLPLHEAIRLCDEAEGCAGVVQRLNDNRQYYKRIGYEIAKDHFLNNDGLNVYTILKHRGDKQEILDNIPTWSNHVVFIKHKPRYMDEYAANLTYDRSANKIVNGNQYLKEHSMPTLYGNLTYGNFRRDHAWELQDFYDLHTDASKSQLKNYWLLKLGMLDLAKRQNRIKSQEEYDQMLKETQVCVVDPEVQPDLSRYVNNLKADLVDIEGYTKKDNTFSIVRHGRMRDGTFVPSRTFNIKAITETMKTLCDNEPTCKGFMVTTTKLNNRPRYSVYWTHLNLTDTQSKFHDRTFYLKSS